MTIWTLEKLKKAFQELKARKKGKRITTPKELRRGVRECWEAGYVKTRHEQTSVVLQSRCKAWWCNGSKYILATQPK